jgi:serine/threonine protein kinase
MANNVWKKVGHNTHVVPSGAVTLAGQRTLEVEQELHDRQTIRAWDEDEHWPSIHKPLFSGPDAKRFDLGLAKLEDLGYGAFGRVEKVSYGSVCLARKRVRRRGFRIEDLHQEALTMRKLDHRHVVKLVAAYAPRAQELCLLIWPAAVCNLSILLEDLECLRLGEGDREDILERLDALDIRDLSAIEPTKDEQRHDSVTTCPLEFLRHIIGCIARALAYCHANDVRHLDIKPSNILLRPDRVYLADFGISRDVSGQDQTMTEGLPGTEKWRAPEFYNQAGSSMQFSDIYSLGLVYLNIATVLYNVRLSKFDETLQYSPRLAREDQLLVREEKIKKHLDTLMAHALVTPPFMFTYEGQETVRPRPIVSIIARMVAPIPRHRTPVDKVDDKLSMIGGIHQIYHGECCKRPISWVEDKWDKKFAALASFKRESEAQQRRITELEGRDKTYELRLENARRLHEQDVLMLQAKLEDAEQRCQKLEKEKEDIARRTHGRPPWRGNSLPAQAAHQVRAKRNSVGQSSEGSRLGKSFSTPSTPQTRPSALPAPRSSSRINSTVNPGSPSLARQLGGRESGTPTGGLRNNEVSASRSPSLTNLPEFMLKTRSTGSRLPLPVTPSGTGTPPLNRDPSSTDSSMASSIFSRRSIETTPTPLQNTPALDRESSLSSDQEHKPAWGQLPQQSVSDAHRLDVSSCQSSVSAAKSPTLSIASLTVSEARSFGSNFDYFDTSGANTTARPPMPSLKPHQSWAEVAKVKKTKQATSIASTEGRKEVAGKN